MTTSIKTLAAGLALAVLATSAAAQSWPTKPVKLIVPFPAGGTTDALPRIMAEKLQAKWGQPVVVENRVGAGGNSGADFAFRAEPDGHTLLVSAPGPLVVAPSLVRKLPFDPQKFVPVTMLATMPNLLVTRPTLPAANAQELVALAKKEAGKLSFGSQGVGTTSHLTAAMFEQMTGTDLVHVPYKGTAPALTDLMGGQIDIMFDNVTSSTQPYKAGRIRALAVAAPKRLATLPEIPTADEVGLKGFYSSTFVAMVAPPGTPAALTARIQKDVAEVLRMPDVRSKFLELGAEPVGDSQAELGRFLANETTRWRDVIQKANVQPE